MNAQDSRSSTLRANVALALSIIAFLFSVYQFVNNTRQFHILNDPVITVDDAVIDTSFSHDKYKVAVLISNHGNTIASHVKVSARLASPQADSMTALSHEISSAFSFPSPVFTMPTHDQKIISGLMDRSTLEYMNRKRTNVYLIVDISYENNDRDKFSYKTIEVYNYEYRKFLVASSFPG